MLVIIFILFSLSKADNDVLTELLDREKQFTESIQKYETITEAVKMWEELLFDVKIQLAEAIILQDDALTDLSQKMVMLKETIDTYSKQDIL